MLKVPLLQLHWLTACENVSIEFNIPSALMNIKQTISSESKILKFEAGNTEIQVLTFQVDGLLVY